MWMTYLLIVSGIKTGHSGQLKRSRFWHTCILAHLRRLTGISKPGL